MIVAEKHNVISKIKATTVGRISLAVVIFGIKKSSGDVPLDFQTYFNSCSRVVRRASLPLGSRRRYLWMISDSLGVRASEVWEVQPKDALTVP